LLLDAAIALAEHRINSLSDVAREPQQHSLAYSQQRCGWFFIVFGAFVMPFSASDADQSGVAAIAVDAGKAFEPDDAPPRAAIWCPISPP
jgi:hypothetical protein